MEAFSAAGESNLVFIINELDKAAAGKGNGNPADVLLTLLDNLGFTDNYIECMIPTAGVYPIATANDRDQISAPLSSMRTARPGLKSGAVPYRISFPSTDERLL